MVLLTKDVISNLWYAYPYGYFSEYLRVREKKLNNGETGIYVNNVRKIKVQKVVKLMECYAK